MASAGGSKRAITPTLFLQGEDEAQYVRSATTALRRARLNNQYPAMRPLADHIGSMSPEIHCGLYGGLQIDQRSGLPTYKEWTRVKTDVEIAPEALGLIRPRAQLEPKARAKPRSIHGKQLIKRDYYNAIKGRPLAPLSEMQVALRRVDPAENTAHFHVTLDKLDVTGVFVRYTIDLAQKSSVWDQPMVTLDEETAGHTEAFKTLIYRFTSLDAEFTFAKLVSIGGLTIERVIKGTIGPFFFRGSRAPKAIENLLTAHDGGMVATFSIDTAAIDLSKDRDNDPMDRLLVDQLSDQARDEYDAGRKRYGFKVFKDRKFVCSRALLDGVRTYCEVVGTRNIIYPADI